MDKKSYLQVPGFENNNDRLRSSYCSTYGSQSKLDDNSNDKYTAAIELSNKCREFYKSRLEAANNMKTRWRENNQQQDNKVENDTSLTSSSSMSSSDVNDNEKIITSKQQRIRVDQAMERLRSEMVSLMDQDLSLMKQLLTLNETIEELKWQSQYYSYSASWTSFSTSKNLESKLSVSDTEMYDSEDDFNVAQHASFSSVQTGHVTGPTWHRKRNIPKNYRDLQKTSVDSVSVNVENVNSTQTNKITTSTSTVPDKLPVYIESSILVNVPQTRYATDRHVKVNGPITVHHERGESSFDSGIHESVSGDELPWRS